MADKKGALTWTELLDRHTTTGRTTQRDQGINYERAAFVQSPFISSCTGLAYPGATAGEGVTRNTSQNAGTVLKPKTKKNTTL